MNELSQLYESKSNDELLLLYADSDSLTAEAMEALRLEMGRRGLTKQEAEDRSQELAFEERREVRKQQRKRLNQSGKSWFGKANVVTLPVTGRERFNTTFFLTFMYLPVVPLGSYRIERFKKRWTDKIIVLEKLPLNWEQVLRAWILTTAILLVAIWTFKLWIYFRFKH